jgi:hypothetical protein
MASVNLHITVKWVEEEPDGSTCFLCDDGCWLTQFRLVAVSGGKTITRTKMTLCQSCHEVMNQNEK